MVKVRTKNNVEFTKTSAAQELQIGSQVAMDYYSFGIEN